MNAVNDRSAVLVNSLLAAGLYATMSYGLAVIYGVMRIINLAHAGILMLGAYATFTLHSRFGLDPFLSLARRRPGLLRLRRPALPDDGAAAPAVAGRALDRVAPAPLRPLARSAEPRLCGLGRRHAVDPDRLHDEVRSSLFGVRVGVPVRRRLRRQRRSRSSRCRSLLRRTYLGQSHPRGHAEPRRAR